MNIHCAFKHKSLILVFILIFNSTSLADSTEMAIFPLIHKPAVDLVDLIKPLVGKQGSATAFSDKLIVRAPGNKLEEIRWLISELDKPARNLLIEVNVSRTRQTNGQGTGITGNIGNKIKHSHIHGHQASTQGKGASQQRIRTIEGHAALIQTGESVPIYQVKQESHGKDTIQSYEVQHKEVTRGFFALPRLHGDQVTLEIHQQADQASTRTMHFNTQKASSIIRGKLGEWIELGGIGEQRQQTKRGLGYSGGTKKRNQRSISLRISEIH